MPGSIRSIEFTRIPSILVGGMEMAKYKEYELLMEPGAKLFIYTDGVAEATNADKELFGMDRAVQALNSAKRRRTGDFLNTGNLQKNQHMVCLITDGKSGAPSAFFDELLY